MNTTLHTVQDFVTDTRTLLQDEIAPYRYGDASIVVAINVTLLEAYRIRPDLFVFTKTGVPPTIVQVNTTPMCIEPPFRLPILFGICAHAMARDQEDYQDARATSFMNIFQSMLLGLRAGPLTGGAGPGDGAGIRGGQAGGTE